MKKYIWLVFSRVSIDIKNNEHEWIHLSCCESKKLAIQQSKDYAQTKLDIGNEEGNPIIKDIVEESLDDDDGDVIKVVSFRYCKDDNEGEELFIVKRTVATEEHPEMGW